MIEFFVSFLGLITWQAPKLYTNASKFYPVPDHDMVLNVSCQMSDPTIKVYLEAQEIQGSKKKDFKKMAGQQIVVFNVSKMDHFFGYFKLFCVADPSSTTETVPGRFEKGMFTLTESMELCFYFFADGRLYIGYP